MTLTILAPIAAIIAVALLIAFFMTVLRFEKKKHRGPNHTPLLPYFEGEQRASQARAAEAAWREQF